MVGILITERRLVYCASTSLCIRLIGGYTLNVGILYLYLCDLYPQLHHCSKLNQNKQNSIVSGCLSKGIFLYNLIPQNAAECFTDQRQIPIAPWPFRTNHLPEDIDHGLQRNLLEVRFP